jgi:hypothetical protein
VRGCVVNGSKIRSRISAGTEGASLRPGAPRRWRRWRGAGSIPPATIAGGIAEAEQS